MKSHLFLNLCVTFLPVVLGMFVSALLLKMDDTRFSVRGVSPSYISAVALLFGLYGGLMAKEIWDKRTALDEYIGAEISSLRSLLRITQSVDPLKSTKITDNIESYIEIVRRNEYEQRVSEANFIEVPPLQSLYNLVIKGDAIRDGIARGAFLSSLEKLRSARVDRLLIEIDKISSDKLAVLFLFGFLTQIAIGLAHAGNKRALITTTMLFSLAFSGAIYTLLRFDDPYRTGDLLSKLPLSKVK